MKKCLCVLLSLALCLGLFGGVVGDLVLGLVGISGSGMIGGMFVSVIGACILIWLGRKLNGR